MIKMAGGYDLPAVRELFRLKSGHGQKEAGVRAAAETDFNRLQNERRGLADEEDRLNLLEEKREKARRAAQEREILQKARDLALKKEEEAARLAVLAGFPEGMEKLRGDEEERIGELEAEISHLEEEVRGYRRGIEDARADLAAAALPEGPVEAGILDTWDERVRALADLDQEQRTLEKTRVEAGRLAAEAANKLGATEPAAVSLSPEDGLLARADSWFRKAVRVRARREELEAKLTALTPKAEIDQAAIDRVRRAADLLRDWLSAPAVPGTLGRGSRLLLPVAVITILAGAFLALSVDPWFSLLGGIGLGLLAVRLAGSGPGTAEQGSFRERYRELRIPPPAGWSRHEVRLRLQELEEELRRKEKDLEDAHAGARVRHALENLAGDEESLKSEKEEICRSTGVDPGASEMEIVDFVDRLRAYREAASRRTSVEAGYETVLAGYRAELKKIGDFLGGKLGERPDDSIEARSFLARLKNRSDRIRNTESRIRTLEQEIASREEAQGRQHDRISDIFRNAGIDPGVSGGARLLLARRLGRREEFQKESERLRSVRGRIAELSAGLRGYPRLLALAPEEAERMLKAAGEKAGEWEAVVREIEQVQNRVEDALRSDVVERALEELEAAAVSLEERYDEALAAAAGELLLSRVEEEYEKKSRPAVLDRAARWFSAFTRARYDLQIGGDPGTPAFRARDTSTGLGIGLAELSDGTRVQLLLAARLAFATQAEAGKTLPVFLDEALTTSDPERFRAVIESLLLLTGEGRQIVYLTANPSDAAFIDAICRERKAPSPNLLDLGRLRKFSPAGSDRIQPSPPGPERIPAPEDRSPEDYAALLGVPPLESGRPVTAAHLFYLLYDNLPLLYIIMKSTGAATVGQWMALARSGGDFPEIGGEDRGLIEDRGALLDLFLAQYSIGRGKPLDREVLEKSGAVSPRYLDDFTEMARELGNDARAFMKCLEEGGDPRTGGFLKKKKEALSRFLEENECIDRRERLTREEIIAAALDRPELSERLSPEEITARITEFWDRLTKKPTRLTRFIHESG